MTCGRLRRSLLSALIWLRPRAWGFAGRLALLISVLIIVACVALSWILVRSNLQEMRRNLVERGQTIAEYLARDAELNMISGDVDSLRHLAQGARVARDVAYCRFFDRDGRLLTSAEAAATGAGPVGDGGASKSVGPVVVGPDMWEFQAPVLTMGTRPQREEIEFLGQRPGAAGRSPPGREQVGTVVVGLSTGTLDAQRQRMLVTAAFFTVMVTFFGVLCAVVSANAVTRPLQTLARAADAIAAGDLNASVRIDTQDEVRALAESFNAMVKSLARSRAEIEQHNRTLEEKVRTRTERLEALNQELQEASRLKSEFLATVSHELRTPLKRIARTSWSS